MIRAIIRNLNKNVLERVKNRSTEKRYQPKTAAKNLKRKYAIET